MRIQIEAARQTVAHALALKDAGLPFTMESAIAKTMGSDTAMQVTTEALGLLGAYGYSHDCVVEKLVRDAKIQQLYEGTNQVQRLVIAGHLMASILPKVATAKAGKEMSYPLTEDQQLIQKNARDFAKQYLEPLAVQLDKTAEFPADVVKTMAEHDFLAGSCPLNSAARRWAT